MIATSEMTASTTTTGDMSGSESKQMDSLIPTPLPTGDAAESSNGANNVNNAAAFDGKTRDVPVLAAPPSPRGRNQAAAHKPTASPLVGAVAAAAANGGAPSLQPPPAAGAGDGPSGVTGAYHPDFMFCGDCASCAAPPPPPVMPLGSMKRKRKPRQLMKPPGSSSIDDAGGAENGIQVASMGGTAAQSQEGADDDTEGGFVDDDGGVFDLSSPRTSIPPQNPTAHRSRIHVANLTTPGQVLVINSILEPLPGVTRLVTSLSDQTVSVDHDPLIVGVNQLASSLREMGYVATVSRDGALDLVESSNPTGICRSTLYVEGICCASEVPAVKSILKSLGRDCVTKVAINITTRTVYVDHDPYRVPADMLADALNRERFGAKVKKDGKAMAEQQAQGGAKPVEIKGTKGRSAFGVQKRSGTSKDTTLKEEDVSTLQAIISAVAGVAKIGINMEEGIVYVDHDTLLTSADDVQSALEKGGYVADIRVDAGAELRRLGVGKEANGAAHREGSHVNDLGIRMSRFVETTLHLPSLQTLDEVRRLERAMRKNYLQAQVRAFYPHIPSRTVKVEHDPKTVAAPDIAQLLHTLGFEESVVVVDGAVENLALPEMDTDAAMEERGGMADSSSEGITWIGGIHFNVVLSGLCWFISILSIVEGWEDLKYAGIASVIFGIPPVAIKAWRTVRRRQIDANVMMVIAAFGALFLGEFDEAASVAFLFAVSEFLEARATAKARRALGAIVSLRPDHANLINRTTGETTIVPATSVPVGSHVSVRTGDKIPADGIVEEGSSTVDESSLTGESRPISKQPESAVSGGSINVGQTRLVIRTTSTVDDSAVSRLIRLVEEAQSNRSPTEKLVDSFAKRYTPIVLTAALFMCTIPWLWGVEVGRYWTLNGLIIVVISCPCALTISTPVTYAAGLAATAQRGIIVKGGARLEALGNVTKVVLDKTGTITEGNFDLIHLNVVGDSHDREQVLALLALMEGPSSHPLSATLVNAAKKEGIGSPVNVSLTSHTILKGEGVTARVDNKNVYVGNERLFERLGLYGNLDDAQKRSARKWSMEGGTVGFIGIEGVGIIGMFCVSDKIRDEAKDVITNLIKNGYEVTMLTGDSDGAAKAVGRAVGLPVEAIHSHLMPEDKLHYIGSIRGMGATKQPVMCGSKELCLFTGDGVNDAPALAVADVGVAMGEGAALAMEMSDVTLMDSNLTKLTYSIEMGAKVIKTIRENIILSLVAKAVVVALTFVGKMTLLWAIASDVGIMLVVTLNGMKLLPGRDGVSLASERDATMRRKRGGRYKGVQTGPGAEDEITVNEGGYSEDNLPEII